MIYNNDADTDNVLKLSTVFFKRHASLIAWNVKNSPHFCPRLVWCQSREQKLGVPNFDKIQQKQGSEEWLMKVQFSGNVTELLSKEASIKIHSGPENFRKVQATKNSWNNMNQFRRSFLILENWNCILISQLFQK